MAKTKEVAVKEKRDLRAELTERLLSQMETGTAFWQRPWEQGELEAPFNAVTGKPYRGVNSQNLMMFTPDPADNRWCTYKQAQEQGWQVKKGEHGTQIEKWTDYNRKLTDEEIRVQQEKGVDDPETEERRMGVRYFTVFHASQIDGIPPRERPEPEVHLDNAVDDRLPKLAETMGVAVQHSGTRAFYRPSADMVNLPPLETFKTGRDHDTIFLHELSHATGGENRLNRDLTGVFGSDKYAKEELRAELSAAMTAMSLGLGFSPDAQGQEEGREVVSGVDNTAAYLTSWLKGLPEKDQKKELMAAISEAQKISDYLIERTPELEKGLDQELVRFVQEMTLDDKDNHIEAIRAAARVDPEKAGRWAEELRGNPHEYAEAAGPDVLHADNVRGLATQLEIGALEKEKTLEQPVVDLPLSVNLSAGERYPFHSDAGHGWLEVAKSDLKLLGIEGEITPYSYQRGDKAFLEEDKDALTFHRALERQMGREMRWESVSKDIWDGDESRIRNYAHYEAPIKEKVMDKTLEQEPEKQVYHKVILTPRRDLTARVLREPIDPSKPILEIVNHPRQEISGVLKDFSNSEFILNTPEYGDVRVETHKKMFAGREEELREAKGKTVDVSIDDTGKDLSLAVHQGAGVSILQDHFETPLRPVGLLPMVQMSRPDAQPITGRLTYVHDSNLIELKDPKGRSALVRADNPGKENLRAIQDRLGKQVRVLPGEKLLVASLEWNSRAKGIA